MGIKRLVHPPGKEPSKSIRWNSFRNSEVLLAANTGDMIRLVS
jgi:hypothetical protein